MPFTVASGLHPHSIPKLKTKVKPQSRCFTPPCPCCPHPCFPGKAAGKGKLLRVKENCCWKMKKRLNPPILGAWRGQRTAAPA